MAEDQDSGDKTELPTDRRREEVRERGNVARSIDLNVASSVLVAAAVLNFFGGDLALTLLEVLRKSLSAPAWVELDIPHLMNELLALARPVGSALLPALALVMVSAVAVNGAQVGFVLTTESLIPNFERINPLAGARRLLSLQSTVRLAGGVLKLVVSCAIVIGFISSRIPAFLNGIDADTASFCHQLGGWLAELAFQMALGLVTLAVLDYGFQLWRFEQDIRMTKQEIRDEMRHMEGDPHIRQRRREAHRKLTNARQVQQTKNADVVITNPTELAIAIKYDPGKMDAPVVLAKGKDLLAAQIRRIAAEHGIPIVEKKPLAQALYRMVKVGQPIPGDLYEGVAEILAYVYRLSKKTMKRTR
ncbi:MAG TPA: EscU/YscU/HrcU family type III secretion system export apparatus switch protein [Planctomycetaceae bacterium]